MVVCHWRTAHSLRADGTGRCAGFARRNFSGQWSRRLPLVRHHDCRWGAIGRLRGIGDESTPVDKESEDRPVDALFEM